jgi:hypothetical protein
MKSRLLLSFTFLICIQIKVLSQPCLPEGIGFYTQVDIDNFQTNYPNCNIIEGFVTIQGNDIYNLNGLSHLNSIRGDLYIFGNPSLTSLAGLEGLTAVGGTLLVGGFALTSLTGLGSLTSIGGDLTIMSNDVLPDLSGLNSLTYIGDSLTILNNPVLTSLTGLDNLDAGSISNLIIIGNWNLSSCDVQSICDYLASPNGIVDIRFNATGCNNPPEVASACGITLPCLPFGNYYFVTQADIDNFQANYPDCTELEGDVEIGGSDITNLEGLSVLHSISGDLSLSPSLALTSLTGLEGLTTVGGSLRIPYLNSLISLTGLESLLSVGGDLEILGNDLLASMTGLEGLNTIGGNLRIGNHFSSDQGNYSLSSLTGLNNLVSIGGYLDISNNHALTSIMGLENLTSIGGDLWIIQNNSLSICESMGICNHFSNPEGMINIYNNDSGCNSIIEVAVACGGPVPCLPYGNYYFASQADVDNFQAYYPDCTELEGDVTICGNDIMNLNGLNAFTSFGGSLQISNNYALINLTGLENLTSGGYLSIYGNTALINLTGLEGLSSVESLNIGIPTKMGGSGNPSLTSLTGLEGLTTIDGGTLVIMYNQLLSSLTGLDNVEAVSITDLRIYNNGALSTCAVQSICDYLANPNGTVFISGNASGCISQEEVEVACETIGLDEIISDMGLNVYPNPSSNHMIFHFILNESSGITLEVLNNMGQVVAIIDKSLSQGEQQVVWDAENMPAGLYFYRLIIDKQPTSTGKLIVVR